MEKLIAAIKIFLLRYMKMQYMCEFMTTSSRFPVGKTELVWEASLRCHTFC